MRLITLDFWKRWYSEYLTTLQPRKKWTREKDNLKEGDLVLIADDDVPPLQWPLARIITIYTGNDDLCRAVKIKTAEGIYKRPIVKLRKLPISPERDLPPLESLDQVEVQS